MNLIRNVIRVALALPWVILSLSGFAAPPVSKNFGVIISPLVVPPGAPKNLAVAYSNTSPPASNSAINSTILTLPASSGLTINSVGAPAPSSCVIVPVTGGATQVKCSGFTGVKPGDPPFVVTVNVTAAAGCHNVTWAAQAFAGNSWSGDAFTFQPASSSLLTQAGCEQFTGTANCGDTLQLSNTDAAQGSRAFYNKDGGTCVLVNYNFTNTVNIDGSALLRWDTQSSAVFSYTVTANPTVVDTTGIPPNAPRPRVAWEFDINGNPLYKPYGVACVSSTLPTPYGALSAAINNSTTSITVDTTTGVIAMPAAPFPLAVGSERMQVTAKVSAGGNLYTLTVQRGTGNLGADAASHSAGDVAMSTPLPIDPNPKLPNGAGGFSTTDNPYYQKQAQICIAARGWTAFDQDPATNRARVRWWSYIFDVGDGWYSVGD